MPRNAELEEQLRQLREAQNAIQRQLEQVSTMVEHSRTLLDKAVAIADDRED